MKENVHKKSRYKIARNYLIFWTLFIGIGAVGGALAMIIDPSGKTLGMDAMLPYFKKLPFADVLFTDFTFSGWALLIVNGLTNLMAAGLLFANKKAGSALGCAFGVTLMLWICIQFYMFPFNFMSTAYFIFGFLQAVTGYCACTFLKQESFKVIESDYKNVGTNQKELVVYFSRMGYVKKVALEIANKTGAEICEIKTAEKTDGTLGFWWCGRFGMHRWGMPILPVNKDIVSYEKVTVCSPIWVFSLSSPMREFCKQYSGKIKKADYVLVHHTNGRYDGAVKEMDELLEITHGGFTSIRCRKGVFKQIAKE